MAPKYYVLRASKGNEEVVTCTVAIVPGAHCYPNVGETIGDNWRVMEIVKSSEDELHLRVEPTTPEKHG